jgi:hypothetical protein
MTAFDVTNDGASFGRARIGFGAPSGTCIPLNTDIFAVKEALGTRAAEAGPGAGDAGTARAGSAGAPSMAGMGRRGGAGRWGAVGRGGGGGIGRVGRWGGVVSERFGAPMDGGCGMNIGRPGAPDGGSVGIDWAIDKD